MPNQPPVKPKPPTNEDVVIPALLRSARGAYAHAIGTRLAMAGFEDMPRNGSFVLGGMAQYGGSAGDLIRELRITKQAASQLIDTLVVRGYLERTVNADDRRRMTIELTERGRAAATVVYSGVEAVDAELARRLSAGELAGLRAGLWALTDIAGRTDAQAGPTASDEPEARAAAEAGAA